MIQACISFNTFSISINGRDVGFFRGTRRLRQGCLMAPYLFILVMQRLTDLLLDEVDKGEFTLHQKVKTQLSQIYNS